MFRGSMVAIATPMRRDGSIDYDAFAQLIEWHIENDTDVIVPAGTTGESATLDNEEHCEVIRFAVQQVKGRVPVMAGTGANSTTEAVMLTQSAKESGADGVLLVTPYYNKPTQEGLYQHYKKIAAEVAIPQVLYNVPGRTACDMLPETIQRLSGLDHIIGVKEATGDLARARKIMDSCGPDFLVIGGEDAVAMELMLQGGHGVISVTANVAPRAMHDMSMLALDGDREGAEAINRKLDGLHKKLFIESNPIPVKWALHEMSLIPDGIRLPLTALSESCHEPVRQALIEAGCL